MGSKKVFTHMEKGTGANNRRTTNNDGGIHFSRPANFRASQF
jgi:hypothetical protein